MKKQYQPNTEVKTIELKKDEDRIANVLLWILQENGYIEKAKSILQNEKTVS